MPDAGARNQRGFSVEPTHEDVLVRDDRPDGIRRTLD
jgi:hypothetical protein